MSRHDDVDLGEFSQLSTLTTLVRDSPNSVLSCFVIMNELKALNNGTSITNGTITMI